MMSIITLELHVCMTKIINLPTDVFNWNIADDFTCLLYD